MTRMFMAYLILFILAAVPMTEAYIVIPVGIFGGLNPLAALTVGVTGNVLTVLLLIVFMDRFRNWMENRRKKRDGPGKRNERAGRLFRKYGVPGLALLGPLIVGSHLTAFLAVSLGGTRRAAFLWVTASIIIWSVLTAVLVYFGVDFMGAGDKKTFLRKYLEGA